MKISVSHFVPLNVLHIFNDGFQASLILLLPFIATAQHLSLTEVGALGTILNVAGIVLALPAAYIATKIGGLKTLVIALLIYGLGFLGAGVFGGYYLLVGMFLLAGVGFGLFHPIAFALIAKWSPKERRGRIIGNFTAIGDVGRIGISAAVSFIVVAIGWQKTAILYAAAALLMGIGMYFFLPFLLLTRGIDPAFLGTFTAAFFVGNLFGKTLLGRLVDKFGNAKVFITSELLMALFIFLLANTTAAWLIVGCSIILGIFTKGTVPVQQTMVSEAVEHHGNFEKAFGIGALVTGIAITIAPLTLGAISDELSIISAFNVMALVALTSVVPAFCYYLTRPKNATK